MACKRFHLGLGAAALVLLAFGGVGFANGPAPVGPAGPCCAADGGCATGCCTICQPVQHMKTVVKRVYGEKCEDFCVCRPTFLGGLFNLQEAIAKDNGVYQGNCCGCKTCGHPYTKKFLLIHNREHQECEMKCEIPAEGAAPGIIVAPPSESADRARTPNLNPLNAPITQPSGGNPSTPQPAPGENPRPRTPGLNPGN